MALVCLMLLSINACQTAQPSPPTLPPEALAALLATVPPSPTVPLPTPMIVRAQPMLMPTPQDTAAAPAQVITAPHATAMPSAAPQVSAAAPEALPLERVQAKIMAVVDGDTLLVQMADGPRQIDYWGCQVPDDITAWQQEQCAAANRVLLAGQDVRVERDPLAEAAGVERYYVWNDTLLVNAELVRMGYAQVSQDLAGSRYEALLLDHQGAAQQARLGIWAELPTQTPPPTLVDASVAQPVPSETSPPPTSAPAAAQEATGVPTKVPSAMPLPTATALPPTSVPEPTAAPPPTMAPVVGGQVVISYVFFDGVEGRNEPDEYCELTNQGDQAVQLEGWRLNAGAQGQDLILPNFVLGPGQVCRVYTNQVHEAWGGLSFGSGSALWKNSGDCGYLYDAGGAERSSYCYD